MITQHGYLRIMRLQHVRRNICITVRCDEVEEGSAREPSPVRNAKGLARPSLGSVGFLWLRLQLGQYLGQGPYGGGQISSLPVGNDLLRRIHEFQQVQNRG